MNKTLLAVAGLGLLLHGCSTVTKSAVAAEGPTDYEAQGELMYQMLVAELAGRRGRVDLAMDGYLKASRAIDDPRLAERAARLAVYAKAWDSAFEAGTRWAELEPDNVNAQRLLVGVHLRRGDVEATADAYERILELASQPFDEGAASVLTSLAREPDLGLAVEVAQALSARNPDSAMGHFLVARLAVAAERPEVALRAFDRTLEISPDMGRANLYRAQLKVSLGREAEALSQLHAYLERSPSDISSQLGFVNLLQGAGRGAEAEARSNVLFSRHRRDGQVVFELGLSAIDGERFDAAVLYLNRAVELDHKADDAHYFIGRVAQTRRQDRQAVAAYDQVGAGQYHLDAGIRAAELAAGSDSLEVALARLATLGGQFADQESARRLAMAEASVLQAAGRLQRALEVLNQALQAQPADADLRYARGLAAERSGDTLLFEADMQALIKQDAKNAHAMNALGYSLTERGERLEEAGELIDRALAIEPEDPAILDSRGWLYFKLGDHGRAIEYLQRAYARMEDPEIAAHLSEALWVAGRREEARALLDAALTGAPGDQRLLSVQGKFD